MDPDCLDRNQDMITAALSAHAAGRVEDSFKYLERLHKDIVDIANVIDRADERSMLEGLKYGTNKKKALEPSILSSSSSSSSTSTTMPTTTTGRNLIGLSTNHRNLTLGNHLSMNVPSLASMSSGIQPNPILSLPHPHLMQAMPNKMICNPSTPLDHHPKISQKITKPFVSSQMNNTLLAVCPECKQKKKGKVHCRQDLKHTAPPWNADLPQKEKRKRMKRSDNKMETQQMHKFSGHLDQMQAANTNQQAIPLVYSDDPPPPPFHDDEVECDEFSDEDLL